MRPQQGVVSQASLYTSFREFSQAHDFRHAFDEGNKIYALWMSGDGVIKEIGKELVLGSGVISRLLLPDPSCVQLKSLLQTLGDGYDYKSIAKQIRITTQLAIQYKVPVRWT